MSNRNQAKQEMGIPDRLKVSLQEDGWICRQTIIWAKPNPMPESVRDRCTRSHEYIFLLTKSAKYWYDADAISEPLATNPKENYPARAKITGRGTQGAANARGNDRDKSGGFPPRATDKQSQLGKRTYTSFNARWDNSEDNGTAPLRRNKRSVWTITPKPFAEAHFATFPPEIPDLCIRAGCPPDGMVLDPFAGAGTTGIVAQRLGRSFVGIELNAEYVEMAKRRLERDAE